MKKIIGILFTFFLFYSQTYAFDMFVDVKNTTLNSTQDLEVRLEIVSYENISNGELSFSGMENFSILSQSTNTSIALISGGSSYKQEQYFILEPKKSGKLSFQVHFTLGSEKKSSQEYIIEVKNSRSSVDNSSVSGTKQDSSDSILFLYLFLGLIIFIYFYYFFQKNNKKFDVNTEKITKNNYEFDTYEDLFFIISEYIRKNYKIHNVHDKKIEEIFFILEEKISDTEEKNAIKSIIFSIKSSQYSRDKIDKNSIFHKISALKFFNEI